MTASTEQYVLSTSAFCGQFSQANAALSSARGGGDVFYHQQWGIPAHHTSAERKEK